jgi:hypothetical protein
MRHLLAFNPIAVHMFYDVAKLFAVQMLERRGNLLSFLARRSSTSLQITSHPGPLCGSGWAAAVAALRSAARFLDVEVVGLLERCAVGQKSGRSYETWLGCCSRLHG